MVRMQAIAPRSKTIKYLVAVFLLLMLYPAFVYCYVWWHCYKSPFEGGMNGQLDAYRHTLASAVVAYTTSEKTVELATLLMERKNREPNVMDQHNNAVGAAIGAQAHSFSALNIMVAEHVKHGAENTQDATQTTWLAKKYWRKGFFW